MKRGDALDLEAGDVNSHLQDTTWLRQLFEWVFSDDLAHAHATYLIERQRTKLQQRQQWGREAAEVRRYAASIKAVPPDPIATALVRDMLRYEAAGKVIWTGDGWRKPMPHRPAPRQPLTADQLLGRFERVRKIRDGWQVRCPAHDDKTPSLSIRCGDRWWLTFCHAGCSTRAICAAVGLEVAELALGGSDG